MSTKHQMKLQTKSTPNSQRFPVIWIVLLICLWAAPLTALAKEPPSFQGNRRPYTQVVPPYLAPIVTWHKPKGGITNIARYRGKVVVLNFWATWCPACLYEMPDLDTLESVIGHADFSVVTVNLDETNRSKIAAFFDRLNLKSLPLLSDPLLKSIDSYGIREGLPWTFLIDRKGLIRGYLMGAAHWLSPEGQSLIRYYLDE